MTIPTEPIGSIPRALELIDGFANIQANPRSYLAHGDTPVQFYVDSLVHDPNALRLLVKFFGAQRVALGSDYPFPLGEAHPGELIESLEGISAAEKSRLLSGTAEEFLGVPKGT